jgi:hypothetical protein
MRLIKEYDEYAKDLPMIIESKVEFSDGFCNIISKINSPLSKVILSLQNTEKDIEKNYLDLGKGNDSISFVIDAKAKTLGEPWKQSRNEIRVGKIVRSLVKLSGESFTEKQIEDFVNKFKAVMDSKGSFDRFEIVSGEEILKYYNINNYEDFDEGQLGQSCLNNKPHEIFDMYVMNPNVVKLVILKAPESDKIIGRALLWQTNEGLFMDRIYTSKDSDVALFKMYAGSIDSWSKELQTSSYKYRSDFHYFFQIEKNGEMKKGDLIVQLDNYGFNKYPYLDTFCYYNRDTGQLCNDKEEIDADILVCNTDGGYKESDFEWSS